MTQQNTDVRANGNELEKLIAAHQAMQYQESFVRQYLDRRLSGGNRLLVTKGKMGTSESWHGSASLNWINRNVRIFVELPLFKDKIDEDGRLKFDATTVNELRQRAPDYSRQPILVNYLLGHKSRTFPPILVVVEEPWVNNPDAPEWGPDKKATRTSVPITETLDGEGKVGIMDVADTVVYAIDGSHRKVGIAGLFELLETGRLTRKRKDGTPTSKADTLDSLIEKYKDVNEGISHSSVANMAYETMGVEFIPAVMEGETREEARMRVRSVFVHVNKSARPPTAGEQVLLDEDDGFSIIARTVALEHPLFKRREAGDRVNWRGTALPAGGHWLTSGKILRDLAEQYLSNAKPYEGWKVKAKEIALRPPEEYLEKGKDKLSLLMDYVATLPSFNAIMSGEVQVDQLRELPDRDGKRSPEEELLVAGERDPEKRGHLLMRPVGQLILARAVGQLHLDPNGPELGLDEIFERLYSLDEAGKFENVHRPSSYWFGITYDPQRHNMVMEGRHTAVKLLRYLLNGLPEEEEASLRGEFAQRRTMPGPDDTDVYLNFDGTDVGLPNLIDLPPRVY